MFQINDAVMYGHSGVCTIVDIAVKNFTDCNKEYYVLQPVYHNGASTYYCPVDRAEEKIRPLLSEDEVLSLIQSMPDLNVEWIDDDHSRKLQQMDTLKNGDQKQLIQLIKSHYLKKEEKVEQGKKFHVIDEKAMTDARSMLHQEFAYVLNISPDEVISKIDELLEANTCDD